VGDAIARRGHVLVYGGGRTGLMGSVADAALAAGGVVHGVILREFIEQDVHHTGIAELHLVEDMRSRKAGLDHRADSFVALPGGLGTLEELAEILSFRKLGHHHRNMVLLSSERYFDPLVALFEHPTISSLATYLEGPGAQGPGGRADGARPAAAESTRRGQRRREAMEGRRRRRAGEE